MQLEKFSMGIGDRFYHQGAAQLQGIISYSTDHVKVSPVWNKSYREHQIVGTKPESVLKEAQQAVEFHDFKNSYYIDADHIGLDTVDDFIEYSNYFTLDVVDYIGGEVPLEERNEFVDDFQDYISKTNLPGNLEEEDYNENKLNNIVDKYLPAVKQADKIYKYIKNTKETEKFITEVSMDETDSPQTPEELFLILFALAKKEVPVQVIAPKFSGEFLKGIDYVGDVDQFQQEVKNDIQIISFMTDKFDLPDNLKLSMHSGSDKYSIYPKIKEILKETDSGFHLKTAGTTWLEELHGLILSQGEGLKFVKDLYKEALRRIDELAGPYQEVIDIDRSKLPSKQEIETISAPELSRMLVNDPEEEKYNSNLRQLFHISYKLAAEAGDEFFNLLENNKETISEQVEQNIYRHLDNLFPNN